MLSRHSLVVPAGDAVLKIVPPEDDESDEEADALALWDGDGAVRLLRHDRARRALLLERAHPGNDLTALSEAEAVAVAVDVATRLWRPAGEPFRWIGDHVPRWLESAPGDLGDRARELYATLDVGRDFLVHGDLHHHNILRSARGWVAIDPKPMLGEPEFDVPSFLWNPLPCRLRVEHVEERIAAFVTAGLDEERIRTWTVIRGAYLQPQEAEVLRTLV
ncbi:MAG TPA: aminoglycoside phosphotransferase family protein [Gaiellaceae bacterium]|nr:aminoglycoside phosphotransferase family protein [Gaiellaceae bacterium]